MAANSVAKTTLLLCLLLFSAAVIIMVPARTEAAVSCGQVVGNLGACIPYVTNRGRLGGCCVGVRRLYSIARTTGDRRTVCNCLKGLARSVRINYGRAAGLPGQCRVRVPYRISPNTDCSRVR